jgi:hypothetical protein
MTAQQQVRWGILRTANIARAVFLPGPRRGPRPPWRPRPPAILRHINAVLRGGEEPRLLAVDTSLPLARALHDLAESTRRHR